MKTITISDETYKLIKDQLKEEKPKEAKSYIKEDLIKLLKTDVAKFNKVVSLKDKGGCWEDLPKIDGKLDLSGANLSRANLFDTDLSKANLSNADLSWTNLSNANLSGANLSEANLSRANLYRADLSEANLSGANLSEADLFNADLSNADLSNADLSNADLSKTTFYGKGAGLKLKKSQVKDFLLALGFEIED